MELIRNEKMAENTVEIEFKVSAEEFSKAVTAVFKKTNAELTLPGFRKGKAPRNVVEKMYGQEMFFNEALDQVLPQAYTEAVAAAEINPVDRPTIDVTECSVETGVVVKAEVTVYPEVKIGEYKGLTAEKKSIEVTEEVVLGELEKLQNRNARLITAVEGKAAESGDTANIDFEGFADGVAFEGGKGEGFDLVLGSGQFIPGFEEQIVGHVVGDEFDVNVTFPEQYGSSELAGKPAVFKTKLNEIKTKEMPELDDEFAKDVSDFDTLEEFKASIKAEKETEASQAAELDVENTLVEKLVDSLEANIPNAMNETRIDEMVRDFQGRLEQQGLKFEMYLEYTQMTMESFRKTFEEQAAKQVKIRLALEKVAELENIVASDEDLEAELTKISEAYNMPVDTVRQLVPLEEIKKDLAISKAIDFVKESANITNA